MHLNAHESNQCTVCTSTLSFQCPVIHFVMLNKNKWRNFAKLSNIVTLVEANIIAASFLGLHTASYAISLELTTSLEVYKFYNPCLKETKAPRRAPPLPIIYSVLQCCINILVHF